MVVVDEEKKTLVVVAPDDQLSLAIGRQGQNVRLASKLLGWNIGVKSEAKYAKSMEEGYKSLLAVAGVDEKLADRLYDGGYTSAGDLAEAASEELAELLGGDQERARAIIGAAAAVPRPEENGGDDEGSSAGAPPVAGE
jgi:N utilization substance protein A